MTRMKPKPRKQVCIDPPIHKRLKKKANDQGRRIESLAQEYIVEGLKK